MSHIYVSHIYVLQHHSIFSYWWEHAIDYFMSGLFVAGSFIQLRIAVSEIYFKGFKVPSHSEAKHNKSRGTYVWSEGCHTKLKYPFCCSAAAKPCQLRRR
jgi:hypothetical protein